MRRRSLLIALGLVLTSVSVLAATNAAGLDPGNRFQPQARQHRVIAGDLCATALELGRNQTLTVDLCEAWNDYDPGSFGCSPCALPGPEVVARLDTQAGEQVRVSVTLVSGNADVRLYLATDCEDPENTCLVASSGTVGEFEHTLTAGGEVFLYIDTTGECGTVQVSRQEPATAHATTFSALKAVYR